MLLVFTSGPKHMKYLFLMLQGNFIIQVSCFFLFLCRFCTRKAHSTGEVRYRFPTFYGKNWFSCLKYSFFSVSWDNYLFDNFTSVAIKKPVGILHVKVVRASKLLKKDFLGTSDPYVKLSLTGEKLPWKKTTVKKKNLNPEWNENFKLVVKEPESQILQLQVFDWDKVFILSKLLPWGHFSVFIVNKLKLELYRREFVFQVSRNCCTFCLIRIVVLFA